MMALYHRKLLFAPDQIPDSDKKISSDCYMCYVCPEDCYISPPPPQLSPPDPGKKHFSTVLILMFCILGVAFLVLSYLTIARYRLRNSRRRNPESLENSRADFLDENQGPVLDHPIWYIRTVGLPQSVINSIASFTYKKGHGLIEGNDCSVCLTDFQENERFRLLPKCSHAFHVGCIDTWLRSHKNCPVCRAPILIENTNATRASSNESISSSSGSVDRNQGENELQNRREVETGELRETRSATESRGVMLIQEDQMAKSLLKNKCVFDTRKERIRVFSDLADHRVKVDHQELQPVRRSVSMDFSSASMIYQAVAEGCSDTKLETTDKQNSDKRDCKNSNICKLIKSSSHARSLQKGPVSMKRSFSFSGKRLQRKNSRSQESIQIPEICIQNRGG